ncbi:hypothetical protein [Escherichia phage UPWr_E1]|nr:MAG TPA: hypothetical protein [Caudoviricetes sp.]
MFLGRSNFIWESFGIPFSFCINMIYPLRQIQDS